MAGVKRRGRERETGGAREIEIEGERDREWERERESESFGMAFELWFRQRASRLSERFVNERASGGRKNRGGYRGCGCAVKALATAGIGDPPGPLFIFRFCRGCGSRLTRGANRKARRGTTIRTG